MKDLEFGAGPVATLPRHGRPTTIVTVLVHALLLVVLIRARTHPVRVSSAGTMQAGIAAYVSGPIGGAEDAPPTPPPVDAKKTATARAAKTSNSDRAGASGTRGGQAGSGPVRLGAGGSLTLLSKVTPSYPAVMQAARMRGQVVLDAIIHRDGTIGEITVLQSTNAAFAQAAVAAVRQWRYTPIPLEGIVTVTVNFTLPT
jgi:TonB family protein